MGCLREGVDEDTRDWFASQLVLSILLIPRSWITLPVQWTLVSGLLLLAIVNIMEGRLAIGSLFSFMLHMKYICLYVAPPLHPVASLPRPVPQTQDQEHGTSGFLCRVTRTGSQRLVPLHQRVLPLAMVAHTWAHEWIGSGV